MESKRTRYRAVSSAFLCGPLLRSATHYHISGTTERNRPLPMQITLVLGKVDDHIYGHVHFQGLEYKQYQVVSTGLHVVQINGSNDLQQFTPFEATPFETTALESGQWPLPYSTFQRVQQEYITMQGRAQMTGDFCVPGPELSIVYDLSCDISQFGERGIQYPYVVGLQKLPIRVEIYSDVPLSVGGQQAPFSGCLFFDSPLYKAYPDVDFQQCDNVSNYYAEKYHPVFDRLLLCGDRERRSIDGQTVFVVCSLQANVLPRPGDFCFDANSVTVRLCFSPQLLQPAIKAAITLHRLQEYLQIKETADVAFLTQVFFYSELVHAARAEDLPLFQGIAQAFGVNFGPLGVSALVQPVHALLSGALDPQLTICFLYALNTAAEAKPHAQQDSDPNVDIFAGLVSAARGQDTSSRGVFPGLPASGIPVELLLADYNKKPEKETPFDRVPTPYPLTIQVEKTMQKKLNFVVACRVADSAFLLAKQFENQHSYYAQPAKELEDRLFSSQRRFLSALIHSEMLHVAELASGEKPLIVLPQVEELVLVDGEAAEVHQSQAEHSEKQSKLFSQTAGSYSLFMPVDGFQYDFSREVAVDFGVEQLASLKEVSAVLKKYKALQVAHQCYPFLRPAFIRLEHERDPFSAILPLVYLNQVPELWAQLLDDCGLHLVLGLKQCMAGMFLQDINQRDFTAFSEFLLETQGMFNKSEDGKRFTLLFQLLKEIKILLRGIVLNYKAPRDVALGACRALIFLGDKAFFVDIFAKLSEMEGESRGRRLVWRNLVPGLIWLVGEDMVSDEVENALQERLQNLLAVDTAQDFTKALCFARGKTCISLLQQTLAAYAAEIDPRIIGQAVLTQLALHDVDLTEHLANIRLESYLDVLYFHCLLRPQLLGHGFVQAVLSRALRVPHATGEEETLAEMILHAPGEKTELQLKVLQAFFNLKTPTLTDQPVFALFELMTIAYPQHVGFIEWNLCMKKILIGTAEAQSDSKHAEALKFSDFQCPGCFFGTCNCQQLAQVVARAAYRARQPSKKLFDSIQSSHYLFRGRQIDSISEGITQSQFQRATTLLLQSVKTEPKLMRVIQTLEHDVQTQPSVWQQLITGRNRTNQLVESDKARGVCVRFGDTLLARRVVRGAKRK